MKNKAAQIYGYVVCVVAVITFIIAVASITTAIINMNAPLYSGFQQENSLASFENYKVDAMQNITKDAAYVPTDAELRTMYESALSDATAMRSHQIKRNLIVNSILLLVSLVLFFVHMKWMVRINRELPAAPA